MNSTVSFLPIGGSHAWLRHIELLTGQPIGHGLGYPLPPPSQAFAVRLDQHIGFHCEPRTRWEETHGSHAKRLIWHDYGLFAPVGPLPEHITESILHAPKSDATIRFVGDLTQRLAHLHYRAWAHQRLECDYGKSGLRDFVSLLSNRNAQDIPHLAWHKPRISQLPQLTLNQLGIKLKLACSPLRRIANDQPFRLGKASLGTPATIGTSIAIFGIEHIRITVEALDIGNYRALRDQHSTLRRWLNRLISLCSPAGSEHDLRIETPRQVPVAKLGLSNLGCSRLATSNKLHKLIDKGSP